MRVPKLETLIQEEVDRLRLEEQEEKRKKKAARELSVHDKMRKVLEEAEKNRWTAPIVPPVINPSYNPIVPPVVHHGEALWLDYTSNSANVPKFLISGLTAPVFTGHLGDEGSLKPFGTNKNKKRK